MGVFAVRNLLEECSEIRKLACSQAVRRLIEPVLGVECFFVRGILFDKVPEANWKVPWHQDVTIAVGWFSGKGSLPPAKSRFGKFP
jgi:hypothetical protein